MIAAAALTIEGTYLILKAFVLHDLSDPLTRAGGLSPEQKAKGTICVVDQAGSVAREGGGRFRSRGDLSLHEVKGTG